jgi:maltose/maltodextrin transport system substrate-binding protein
MIRFTISSILLIFFFPLLAQQDNGGFPQAQPNNFGAAAKKAAEQPVHPGIPGKRPFWNVYAKRFIYAPAFDFPAEESAANYRFTAIAKVNRREYTFYAENPWASIAAIWQALPAGEVELTVAALGQTDSQVVRVVGKRSFLKSPAFNGPYGEPAFEFKDSARRCLADLMQQPKIRAWLKTGEPDPTYPLWVHPTKIMGAVTQGMVLYTKLARDPEDVGDALQIARIAADFLLSLREKPGRPLEYWPPTYWDGVPRGNHPVYMDQIMSHYPAEGAIALLDLFDATDERKYFEAVLRIADTYVKTQLPAGTWPQLIYIKNGEAVKPVMLVPLSVIELFNRLEKQYAVTLYRQANLKAWTWCFENPVKTFNWQAQYEDTRPRALYKNLSHREAAIMSALLFDSGKENHELALELLQFVEDQFVFWEKSDPAVTYPWFRPGTVWNANDPVKGSDWFVPAAAEQYVFNTPIAGSTSFVIRAYLKAFAATRQHIYLAKAKSLANTLTITQQYHGGGEIPTHLRRNLPEKNWINVSVMAARTLLECHKVFNADVD